jgi:hypothetical protein
MKVNFLKLIPAQQTHPLTYSPAVKNQDKAPVDLKKGLHVVAEDSNKQTTVKKQDEAPVDLKKGLWGF